MSRHESAHPMRWADLDAYGHVNNVVVLRYLQEARVDMLYVHAAAHGAERLASGVLVVDNEVAYLRPLALQPRPVRVSTWVHRIGAARFRLGYEVFAPDGELTARASTTVAPYDTVAERPRRLDPVERRVLERHLHPELALPQARPPRAVAGLPGAAHSYDCAVRFDDLDMYGHVNNVTYLEYLQEARVQLAHSADTARPAEEGHVVVHLQISYRRPIPFRTTPVTVESRTIRLSERAWTLAYVVRDADDVFATACSTQVAYARQTGRSRNLTPAERAVLLGPA